MVMDGLSAIKEEEVGGTRDDLWVLVRTTWRVEGLFPGMGGLVEKQTGDLPAGCGSREHKTDVAARKRPEAEESDRPEGGVGSGEGHRKDGRF